MNVHSISAIYRFEMKRMRRTLLQSVAAPVITTSLYFIVFGSAIGGRITEIDGIPDREPVERVVRHLPAEVHRHDL
jgi:ABC-2 type transport system permease protein